MKALLWDLGLLRNAISVKETENGLLPLRFTEKQLAVYEREEPKRIRSRCPSGVCIDLLTDSPFVEIDYFVGDHARNWAKFDVLLDGVWTESIGSCPFTAGDGTLRAEIPGAQEGLLRRVTIYLPQLVELFLRSFRVAEGAVMEPAPANKRRLLTLGDSITQGMDGRHPSCSYPVLLARRFGADLINQGVGGYIFQAESLDEELPYRPNIVTVAYGTNDWGRYEELDEFRHACSEYMEKLTACYSDARIYVITPVWRADWQTPRRCGCFAEIGNVIAETCAAHPGVTVIDGMTLVPHQARFFGDGYLHPNDEGFLHYALNLSKHIEFE